MARDLGRNQAAGYCDYCRAQRRGTWGDRWGRFHLLLAVVTAGVWLLVWALATPFGLMPSRQANCQVCGGRLR